ncbi:lipopolysaccharide transport periplasmic protein LptA [Thiovibrio sp. JS02]
MKRFATKLPILLLLFLLVGPGPGLAAPQEAAPAGGKEPIHIEADRMTSLKNENAVLFEGKVDARQGELVIRSAEMTVYYLSEEEKAKLPPGEGKKMKKLLAKGNVEIQNEGWTATGDNMEYFETERKVILTGNTRVWQDNNLVTGERVVLYLDEGKSVVEKSEKKGERVKAFFYPGGEGENKKESK